MTPRANTLPGTHITEEDLYVRAVDPSAGHDAFDCGQGMDLPAVLLGEERCWYADGDETSANQEKRTLILNTYFWSTACHTLLPQWFEQGFSIYYPAAGKVLIKLADPRFIDTLRVPPLTASLHPASLLEPLPQKDLFAIAAQQGLRSDKIFNLDYCALNNPDQEDNIRYLNLNALALLSEEQCDQLLASLAHYQEIGIYLEAGITRYHITFLLDKLNKAFSIVGIFRKENMPEPYLLPEYLHSIMSKNAIRSLVLNDYPVSMFKVIDFEKYDFSKLTKLVTGKHIAVELLYPLLNKQPPLEILELRSAPLDGVVYPSSLTKLNLISTASEVKKIFTQDTPSTVTVTVLEMNFYLIDSIKNFFPIKNINIQFDKAIELPIALKLNNLTECYIETFGNYQIESFRSNRPLPVKKLTMKSSYSNLFTFLDATPLLESLHFYEFPVEGSRNKNYPLMPLSHEKLKEIHLENVTLTFFQLQDFLLRAPNGLQELTLTNCTITGYSTYTFTLGKCKKLTIINCKGFDGAGYNFWQLIDHMPMLAELNIQSTMLGWRDLADRHLLDEKILEHIVTISLIGCTFKSGQLEALFSLTPHLKKLTIKHCRGFVGNKITKPAFAELETLDLTGSDISGEVLAAILWQTKKLDRLILDNCQRIGINNDAVSVDWVSIKLDKLRYFSASHATLVKLQFLFIIYASNQLEKIFLDGCRCFDMVFNYAALNFIHPARFAKLKVLYLNGSNIRWHILHRFIADAQQLEELNVLNCAQIAEKIEQMLPNFNYSFPKLRIFDWDRDTNSNFLPVAHGIEHAAPLLIKKIKSNNASQDDHFSKQVNSAQYLRKRQPDHIERDIYHQVTNHNLPLTMQRVFTALAPGKSDPHPMFDRDQVFTTYQFDANGDVQFIEPHPTEQDKLTPISPQWLNNLESENLKRYKKSNHHLGQCDLELTTQWQALPSKQANERIHAVCLLPTVKKENIEFGFFQATRKHYVRLLPGHAPISVWMGFIQETLQPAVLQTPWLPQIWPAVSKDDLRQLIQDISKTFRKNADGSLIFSKENKNLNYISKALAARLNKIRAASDYEKALAIQDLCRGFDEKNAKKCPPIAGESDWSFFWRVLLAETGACWLRTQAAFAILAPLIRLNLRMARNPLHRFGEVWTSDAQGWLQSDLGGYDSTTNIIEPQKSPVIKQKTDKVVAELSQENDLSSMPQPHPNLITWQTVAPPFTVKTIPELVEWVMQQAAALPAGKQKIELIFSEAAAIEAFSLAASSWAAQQTTPVHCLYIPDVKYLVPRAIHIAANERLYVPSAPLQFLQPLPTHADARNLFIVNWQHYNASAVGAQSLLDNHERQLFNTKVPTNTIVISAVPIAIEMQLNNDFLSRQTLRVTVPNLAYENTLNCEPVDIASIQFEDKLLVPLYHSIRWKSNLLGTPYAKGHIYQVLLGKLKDAILQQKTGIVLINPPQQIPEFRVFWHEDLITHRRFFCNGEWQKLPDGFTVTLAKSDYTWENAKNLIVTPYIADNPLPTQFSLNAKTLSRLFQNYSEQDQAIFMKNKGLLAKHAKYKPHERLTILVAETLSADGLAEVLDTAAEVNCLLHFVLAPGVKLPEQLMQQLNHTHDENNLLTENKPQATPFSSPHLQVITTNKIEYYVAQMRKKYATIEKAPEVLYFPVHEKTKYGNLVESIEPKEKSKDNFDFPRMMSKVAVALLAGKLVVLYGNPPKQIIEHLATLCASPAYLWINGEQKNVRGKVALVTNSNPFPYLSARSYPIEQESIWQILTEEFTPAITESIHALLKATIGDEALNYDQLSAIFRYHVKHPEKNPFSRFTRMQLTADQLSQVKKAWQEKFGKKIKPVTPVGNELNPAGMTQALESLSPETIARIMKIKETLDGSWGVFLVGESGTGKTTLIEAYLKKYVLMLYGIKVTIFTDEAAFMAYPATEKDRAILFKDEANLEGPGAHDDYLELAHTPPKIRGNVLTSYHQVIFAGNFSHFAHRHMHPCLNNIPTIQVKPYTDAALKKEFIDPLLAACDLPIDPEYIALFLKIYHFVRAQPAAQRTTAAFTVRNLQMMVLDLKVLANQYPDVHVMDLAKYAAYDVAKWHVRDKEQLHANCFSGAPVIELEPLLSPVTKAENGFVLVPSQVPVWQALDRLFALCALRETKPVTDRLFQSAGVRSLVLEGPSGIGKSLLLLSYVKSQGLIKGDPSNPPDLAVADQYFYHITGSNDVEYIKAALWDAADKGMKVVFDEDNAVQIEREWNLLLSAKGDKPLRRSGFCLLGARNPTKLQADDKYASVFAFRSEQSDAAENRAINIRLPHLDQQDLLTIFRQRYPALTDETSLILVNAFLDTFHYGYKKLEAPLPTPRGFIDEIDGNIEEILREQAMLGQDRVMQIAQNTDGRSARACSWLSYNSAEAGSFGGFFTQAKKPPQGEGLRDVEQDLKQTRPFY